VPVSTDSGTAPPVSRMGKAQRAQQD